MPKVASFTLDGLDLRFFSSDHLPPHFHAEKPGEWEVRVFFLNEPAQMTNVVYSFKPNRPSSADLKLLKKMAEEHRAELLAEWEAKVLVADPGPDR